MQILKDLALTLVFTFFLLMGSALDSYSLQAHAALSPQYHTVSDEINTQIKITEIQTVDDGKHFIGKTTHGELVSLTSFELIGMLSVVDYSHIEKMKLHCEVVCWDQKGYVKGIHPQWGEFNPEVLPILEGSFNSNIQ